MFKKIALLLLLVISCSGLSYMFGNGGFDSTFTKIDSYFDKPVQPSFYPVTSLMISLRSDDGQRHYMLLQLVLEANSDAGEVIKRAEPLIRNILIQTYGNKTISDLSKANQIVPLQNEGRTEINKVLKKNNFDIHIINLVFTRMVFQ